MRDMYNDFIKNKERTTLIDCSLDLLSFLTENSYDYEFHVEVANSIINITAYGENALLMEEWLQDYKENKK